MSNQALSPGTERRIALLFQPEDRSAARKMLFDEFVPNMEILEKCNETQADRFWFAVLKLSNGDMNELRNAIELAKQDWRDLLVSAGFDQVNSHLTWLPEARS